jgi:predicted ATPase
MSIMRFPRAGNSITEWAVITGAPSSGKTSVFTEIGALGFPTRPEAATICIEARLQMGETLDQICADQMLLQNAITNKAIDIQDATDTTERCFFDRSAIDTLAYCKLYDLDTEPFLERVSKHRFRDIFLLERLPFIPNAVRIENDGIAALLEQYLEEAYVMLGYDVIRVPVMSIRERTAFILDHTL